MMFRPPAPLPALHRGIACQVLGAHNDKLLIRITSFKGGSALTHDSFHWINEREVTGRKCKVPFFPGFWKLCMNEVEG